MLSSAARDVLCEAEAWRTEPDGFVFPTMQSVGKTNRALRKLCKVGGIDRFTSHVFRHTLGSVAADNDIAYETVEKLLGHRGKRTVTHRYIHRGDVSLKRSADKMGDTLLSLMGEEPTDTGSNVVKLPGVA